MASEIHIPGQAGWTVYAVIHDYLGRPWSTSGGTGAFETFDSTHYQDYKISATEQGSSGSAFYTASVPSAIPAGVLSVEAKRQVGGTAVEYDPRIAAGDLQWNGSRTLPLSDLAVSGQMLSLRLMRGEMVQNFGVYFKSSADHVTPYTSGTVSGMIWRDGASSPAALQSGAFTEVGRGFYNLTALTSGDVLCDTAKLLFTCSRSGGADADPLPLFIVFNRRSG